MLWRNPSYLWLLAGVAGLAVLLGLALRRRLALVCAFADAALVSRLTPDLDRRRRTARLILRVLVLTALVVTLAGPQWGFRWEEVHREGIDIIVAIDTSRSMLATDIKPNRLERAKLAVLDLLKLLQGDRVGLVAFAGTAFLECPLTLDYAAFDRSLRAVDVGIIPRGGTALARAIDTSLEAFEARQGKYEVLLLITDGEATEGNVEEAAQRAADRGVKIYSVGIGTTEGELIPEGQGAHGFVKDRRGQVVKSRLDEPTLQQIATTTGGAFVRGAGASLGLDEVFRDHIAKMERREVANTLERRYEERFQIPLVMGLLLLCAEAFVGERKGTKRTWQMGAWTRRWQMGAWTRRWRMSRRGGQAERANRSATAVTLLLVAVFPALVGWFDPPGDRAAEGNRLYAAGKYDEAAAKYGEGLVDAPESLLLQFNWSTALFKQEKYAEAIAALNKVMASGDSEWVARAAYNAGNAQYQLGASTEESNAQAAIASYEQALASYKRAMGADPADEAAKFNHELVAHKIAELKKKLEEQQQREEQQQEQEQQNQEQKEEEQQNQQQEQEDQQEAGGEQEQPEGQPEQEQQQPQQQEQAGEEQGEKSPPPEQAPSEEGAEQEEARQGGSDTAVGGAEQQQALDQQAAHAAIDVARDEELGPEDIQRDVGVAGVGEAAQDW